MMKNIVLVLFLVGCAPGEDKEKVVKIEVQDSIKTDTSKKEVSLPEIHINDSLNAIAKIIAGAYSEGQIYNNVLINKHYINFSAQFSKRWTNFDSTRIIKLKEFREKELLKEIKTEPVLFYPFSGPDILYANLFFPDAEKYILIGLEPVGKLPDFAIAEDDSLKNYFTKLNSALHAILKFSFFRTESMSKDLKNKEVDGTIHLLFLFLKRAGNSLVSARPHTIDSLGNKIYVSSFEELKAEKYKTKGVEIVFKTPENKTKELNYYSANVIDLALKNNIGFRKYLENLSNFNTYLKGASYLLHKPYFSVVRDVILEKSSNIIQDDSGIAFKYFSKSEANWEFKFYGNYTKPISLFRKSYQADLDSLYRQKGSIPLGFGIGYNFKDKNSNLMLAKRK